MSKILIVEDDVNLLNNIKDILETENYIVETAKNGLEGLEKLKTFNPDLIICDIMMPYMDGYEFLTKLQKDQNFSKVPFIFLTAKVEQENIRKGMQLGADDYLLKPFKIENLLDTIKTRLAKREKFDNEIKDLKESILKKIPHEMRTPLVGILGYTDILIEEVDNLTKEEIKEIAINLKLSAKRLHRRVEKFLIYSELLSGNLAVYLKLYPNNFNFTIEEWKINNNIKFLASECNRVNDFKVKIQKATLKISENYFDIILNELIENAMKFSPNSTLIFIDGKIVNDNYLLSIENKSVDFKENSIINFEPLKQLNLENYLYEGIGIGLSIIKKILDELDGKINVNKDEQNNVITNVLIPLKN